MHVASRPGQSPDVDRAPTARGRGTGGNGDVLGRLWLWSHSTVSVGKPVNGTLGRVSCVWFCVHVPVGERPTHIQNP